MIKIDDTLLQEIGLISLPKPERDQLLRQIYETLEMRVGMKLAERMSDQQLDEFERFIDTNDEAGALKWLETNFPDYKQVVASELENLKSEIKKDAPKIIAAMQQSTTSAAMPPSQPPQPISASTQPSQTQPIGGHNAPEAVATPLQQQPPYAEPSAATLQPIEAPSQSPSINQPAPAPQLNNSTQMPPSINPVTSDFQAANGSQAQPQQSDNTPPQTPSQQNGVVPPPPSV